MTWLWPLGAGLVTSAAALLAGAIMLVLRDRAQRLSGWLLAYATGTLLSAAVLGLLPEALARAPVEHVMWAFLAGILAFIGFERLLHARHGRTEKTEHAPLATSTALVILWGDAVHNFLDGVVVGAVFGASPELGATALVAIFVHELPQELGDFAVLLAAGMSPRRALLWNYVSALAILPGIVVAFAWTSLSTQMLGDLLPVAAGAFVYIALADLVPALTLHRGPRAGALQVGLVGLGVATVALLSLLAH